MECLQHLLDGSTVPILTAFLLGLLTAVSPCPLATNIAAVGYISKDLENRRRVFLNGLLYTLGRVTTYTLLGAVLIAVLRAGASVFAIQKAIGKWGEMLIAPALILIGLFMLFGHRLNLPNFGFSGRGERMGRGGGWGALLLGILFLWRSARRAAFSISECLFRCRPQKRAVISCLPYSLSLRGFLWSSSHGCWRTALPGWAHSTTGCRRFKSGSRGL